MNYVSFLRIAVFVALFLCSVSAQLPSRDPAKENPVIEELSSVASPETVESFKAGTEALDSGRFEEAEKQYREVLKQAPDFEPAMRRLGYTLVALGRKAEGLEFTKKALDRNRSVENLVGRASTLLSSNDSQYQPTQAEIYEAIPLAREAWQKSGRTDEDSAVVVAETLLMSNQIEEFKSFARTLKTALPNSARAAYYTAIVYAEDGDLDAAEAELARSKELGAPDETVEPLLSAISTARDEAFFGLGRYRSFVWAALGATAFWILGLITLLIVGRFLSKKTLRAIEESDPNDISGEKQLSLKKVYRTIVSIAGIYYYVSQPFVILLTLAFTAAIIIGFFFVGHIPIGIAIGVVVAGVATIYYMLKALFTRVKPVDPGRALTEAEAPALWQLVRNVADIINTRPVTEIRLTHGSELAVYERGGFRAKLSDQAERILILGAAVLNDFDQNSFRAVLAHEYGHFSNRDTAGGDIAFRVNSDIARTAEAMVASGTNTIYNLGFHFLRLFHFLFRRITHGASRLQEVLADRVAAYHFGPDAFKDGLQHVVRREVEFQRLADTEIKAALSGNRAIPNLYEIKLSEESTQREIDDEVAAVMRRPTTNDDTHPSPEDRFRFVSGIRPSEAEHLHGEVWDLFADRAAITTEMSNVIEKLVRPDWRNESMLGI